MKKAFTILAFAALTVSVFAQAPQKMSYQCVVRNASGVLVQNHPVGMKISILKGSAMGTVVFSEVYTPNPQTNANGLVTIEIGTGTAVTGTFAGIDWSSGPFFLKTEADPSGGTGYTITGTSQLLSVPYALYAQTSGDGFSGAWSDITGKPSFATVATSGSYNDLLNKPVLFSGAWSDITGKPTTLAGYGITDADNSITNEIQLLSISGSVLTLSNGGGSVTLPSGTGLTLPYAGSTSTAGYAFSVTNTASSAVSGKSNATTGTYNGVYGESMSVSGSGVYGKSAKYGVYGEAVRTTGIASIYGVFGKTDDAKGYGVYGQGLSGGIYGVSTAETGTAYGIMGIAISSSGTGVSGTSPYMGIYGGSTGYKGRAIVGEAGNTNSIGVMGVATNENSTGVWGEGANQGVFGKSDLATGKGVFGQVTSATGFSGYFDGGRFYVSGKVGIGTTAPAKKLHVNGSTQVKDTLFATVVDAKKVTIMPGLANSIVGSSGTYHSLATSWAELNAVTITVPASGYVLLIASCSLSSDHDYNDYTQVFIGVSETSDGTGIKDIAHWYVSAFEGKAPIYEFISAQAVMQVTASGSHTFYLMGYRTGGDNTDVVYRHQCHLTAVYYPVAYGVVE